MTLGTGPARQRRRRGRDRGVALVEFGLIAPILFALLFGIVEFGWAFFQNLDVRHGAREGARLAAVNYDPDDEADGAAQRADILAATCERMDSSDNVRVGFTRVDGPDANVTNDDVGDELVVTVEADLDTLTGFFDVLLGGKVLRSTVSLRLEQPADWTPSSAPETCP